MRQPFYQFWTSDQPDFNWLTRVTSRDGEYGMRFRYLKLLCRECSRFALDESSGMALIHIFVSKLARVEIF